MNAFFDDWWDLDLHDQVIARVGPVRQVQAGFKRPVYEYTIQAKDTRDESVALRHVSKRGVEELLLDAMRRV